MSIATTKAVSDAALAKERRRQLLDELRSLTRRAPSAFGSWSHQRTREYKEAALAAQKLLKRDAPPIGEINEAITKLRLFTH